MLLSDPLHGFPKALREHLFRQGKTQTRSGPQADPPGREKTEQPVLPS